MNLLTETLNELINQGKTTSDVAWVGSSDGNYALSWQQFTNLANKDYDAGYGHVEVAMDLIVVGDGWWLERHEYDGSEWWEYKEQPTRRAHPKPFNAIFTDYDSRLGDINA